MGFGVGCSDVYSRTEGSPVLLQTMAAIVAGMDVEDILRLVVKVGVEFLEAVRLDAFN